MYTVKDTVMAHSVAKVVQRCEDCEESGGSMGKIYCKESLMKQII